MLGCPVQCKYCMVTQIDSRREQWEVKPTYGINKTLFFINSKPNSMLPTIPTRWLDYEYVGYQGTSDPFWSVHEYGLHEICELSVSTEMRSLVLVTKMEEAASALSWLKQYKKVKLVVSITGLDLLERTTTASRIKTIQKAKELEIPVLPLIHPYIHGVSNLGFLKTLAKEGVEYVSLKLASVFKVLNLLLRQ
jgi:DNA repair photolyase